MFLKVNKTVNHTLKIVSKYNVALIGPIDDFNVGFFEVKTNVLENNGKYDCMEDLLEDFAIFADNIQTVVISLRFNTLKEGEFLRKKLIKFLYDRSVKYYYINEEDLFVINALVEDGNLNIKRKMLCVALVRPDGIKKFALRRMDDIFMIEHVTVHQTVVDFFLHYTYSRNGRLILYGDEDNGTFKAFLLKMRNIRDKFILTNFVLNNYGSAMSYICEWRQNSVDMTTEDFLLRPKAFSNYFIGVKFEHGIEPVFDPRHDTALLPYSSTFVIPRHGRDLFMCRDRGTDVYIHHKIEVSVNTHQHYMMFKLSTDEFPTCMASTVIHPIIAKLPQTMVHGHIDIPVVAFSDEISVICLRDKTGVISFLDSWNGLYGKLMCLSFYGSLKFGEDALSDLKENPNFVISGLTEVLGKMYHEIPENSLPLKLVKYSDIPEHSLPLNYVKNNDDDFVIEFDFVDSLKCKPYGPEDVEKKAAHPELLLALFLKQQKKAILDATGEVPEKIFFGFTERNDHNHQLSQAIKRAFKMINISAGYISIR